MSTGRRARAARLLQAAGLGRALRRLPLWRGVLGLCYHRIGDTQGSPLDRDLFSATAEEFEEHLAFLARSCDVIGPAEVGPALRSGRGRRVIVTFDDGYRDNHDLALPLLRRHGVPATFFLATGFLDEPRLSWWDEAAVLAGGDEARLRSALARYKAAPAVRADAVLDELAVATSRERPGPEAAAGVWMDWDHARSLVAAGMSIGGHTVSHPLLARLDAEGQRREVAGCAARLEAELGLPMRWFSYPVGSADAYDETTKACLREAGCELAFSFAGGHARPGTDPLDVPRMSVGPFVSPAMLEAATALPGQFARW